MLQPPMVQESHRPAEPKLMPAVSYRSSTTAPRNCFNRHGIWAGAEVLGLYATLGVGVRTKQRIDGAGQRV